MRARRAITLALAAAVTVAVGAAASAPRSWRFVSAPRLNPVRLTVLVNRPGAVGGYIFLSPIGYVVKHAPFFGQHAPMIIDMKGNPVWEHPLPRGQTSMGFQPQIYNGRPVLTWWQGKLLANGIGFGEAQIFDSHYRNLMTIRVPRGYTMDPHEIKITSRGTILFSADHSVRRDLSRFGGPRNGHVWDSVVEEENLKTQRVIWRWDELRHIPLSETHGRPGHGSLWDAYHLNSLDSDGHGNLLISVRNTFALYYVSRRTGRIIWRLGGKRSNFKLGKGVRFTGQHDARFGPGNTISLFDNGIPPSRLHHSRGIILAVDYRHRTVRLLREFDHTRPSLLAPSQGSFEQLPSGGAFIGWGAMPFVSEYDSQGRLLFDAHFPGRDESYRAVLAFWIGTPAQPPSIAVRAQRSGLGVWSSWNGATEVASWQILCGASPTALHPVAAGQRTGFETGISIPRCGTYIATNALDSTGHQLGRSEVVRAPGG